MCICVRMCCTCGCVTVCAQVVQDMDHVGAGGSGHWDLGGHDMEG